MAEKGLCTWRLRVPRARLRAPERSWGSRGRLARPPRRRLGRAEPWLRLALPAVLTAFLVALAAATCVHAWVGRSEILQDAADDIDVLATLAALRLDAPVADRDGAGAQLAALARSLPASAFARGRTLLIADASGAVLASHPALDRLPASLADLLGEMQPLTSYADRAGVMTVRTDGQDDLIATVRNLPDRSGQIALVQPVRAHPRGLAGSCARTGVAARRGCSPRSRRPAPATALQRSRTRAADDVCESVRRRVDTALSRGRCGLWDWDIARGRIYWSDSHVRDARLRAAPSEFLSFGEVNACVHPEDGDLYALAERLASDEASVIDHEFRIRSATGDWVWLRARAELVATATTREPHLVGIAVDITEQRGLVERRRHRRHAPARRHRGDLGSLRAVGCRQPARAVQFEIPEPARSVAGRAVSAGQRLRRSRWRSARRRSSQHQLVAATAPAMPARAPTRPQLGGRPLAADQRAAHQGRRLRLGRHRHHDAEAPRGAARSTVRAAADRDRDAT